MFGHRCVCAHPPAQCMMPARPCTTISMSMGAAHQLGKLLGGELKIAKLKLALSGWSFAHKGELPQAVAKMAMLDLFLDEMHMKHQNKI